MVHLNNDIQEYSFLQPIMVGGLKLRNRIIYPAMGKYIADDDGFITNRYVEYYRNVAAGGSALITPGVAIIDETSKNLGYRQPRLTDDKYIPGLKRAVDAVHHEGALITYQLWHSGQKLENGQLVPLVNDYTIDEIKVIQRKYLEAARRCKQAGADGVEFHIAHNYLPSLFLSPYFNKRNDIYSSNNVENAIRFSLECIKMIVEELCDNTFIITAKINGEDFLSGGITPLWAAAACQLLEQAGVSMITVNGGGVLGKHEYMSDDGSHEEGWKIELAAMIKQSVKIPISGSGGIRHPNFAHKVIKEGKCDLVALGRELVAEPHWINKICSGREEEIRYCTNCMYCFTRYEASNEQSGCSVNPLSKREVDCSPLRIDGNGRVVIVIGAGPAGLEAAVTLAERGFKPIIFEKNSWLGGMMSLAAIPPNKDRINWQINYYQKQVKRLFIDIRLSTEADIETIVSLNPYAVIIATGSNELFPKIPGIDLYHVSGVRDVLIKKPGWRRKTIVIIGGGSAGIETALWLRKQDNNVMVFEILGEQKDLPLNRRLELQKAINSGITILYQHSVEKIFDGKISVRDLCQDSIQDVTVDNIVVAAGARSNDSLYRQLSGKLPKVFKIGDAYQIGDISSAVFMGSKIGYTL